MSQLNEAQLSKVMQSLVNRLGDKPTCPMCKHAPFDVVPKVYTSVGIDMTTKSVDVLDCYPVVITACPNCGHIMLFGAKALGL